MSDPSHLLHSLWWWVLTSASNVVDRTVSYLLAKGGERPYRRWALVGAVIPLLFAFCYLLQRTLSSSSKVEAIDRCSCPEPPPSSVVEINGNSESHIYVNITVQSNNGPYSRSCTCGERAMPREAPLDRSLQPLRMGPLNPAQPSGEIELEEPLKIDLPESTMAESSRTVRYTRRGDQREVIPPAAPQKSVSSGGEALLPADDWMDPADEEAPLPLGSKKQNQRRGPGQ